MIAPEFVYVSYIAAAPERVWTALTEGEFTRIYWYDRRIEADWTKGSPLRFFDGASDVVTDEGVVLEADRPRRLSYTFRPRASAPGEKPMDFSRVTFTLESEQEGLTRLTLVHDQLPSQEMADAFREGWSPILSSLKTFLETGKPLQRLRRLEEQGRPKS